MRTFFTERSFSKKTWGWLGKYWNAVALLLLIAGAITVILLWPSKAEPFNAQSEPLHMTPFAYSDEVNYVVLYGFFAFVFLVILCFLGYIVMLLRRKGETSKEAERLPKKSEEDEEWS